MTRIKSAVPRTASAAAGLKHGRDLPREHAPRESVPSVGLPAVTFHRHNYFGLVGTYDWYPATVSAGDAAIIRREDWRRAQLIADLPDDYSGDGDD